MPLITSRPRVKTTVDGFPLAYQVFNEGNYVPILVDVERGTITDDLSSATVVFTASASDQFYISKSSEYPSQISLITVSPDRIQALVKLVKEDTLFYLNNSIGFQYSVGLKTDMGLMELERGYFNINPSIALGKLSQAPVPSVPPVVSLVAPTSTDTLYVNRVVRLLANASDAGGAIEKVDFYANDLKIGTNLNFSTKGSWDFRYIPNVSGSLTFYAIATDSSGNSTKSNAVAVSVQPEPILPTPNFSFTPLTGPDPLNVTFTNTSVGATSYSWNFGDGSALSTGISPTHTYSTSGNFTITLTATNTYGSAQISKPLVVSPNQAPSVTITNPVSGLSAIVGSSITLVAAAVDSDGTVASVKFKVNGVDLNSPITTPPYTTTWTPTVAGSYTVTAIAVDNGGLSTTSTPVLVGVSTPVPTVAVTAAKAGLINEVQVLSSTVAITGDTVSSVQFQVNGLNQGAADTTAPYSASWTPSIKGTYLVRAIATATQGGTAASSSVPVPIYDTKVVTEAAGISLAGSTGDYVLINNNVAAGGLPVSSDLYVGTTQIGVLNYSADAYNGKPFAFYRASNNTMYTGIVSFGTITLS